MYFNFYRELQTEFFAIVAVMPNACKDKGQTVHSKTGYLAQNC